MGSEAGGDRDPSLLDWKNQYATHRAVGCAVCTSVPGVCGRANCACPDICDCSVVGGVVCRAEQPRWEEGKSGGGDGVD
jgi:hypothetical protein